MAWYDRIKFWEPREETREVAVADYPIDTEVVETDRQNRLMGIALAVAALAFVVLVAVLASWLYNRSNKTPKAPQKSPTIVRPGETVQNPTVSVDQTPGNTNIAQPGKSTGTSGAAKQPGQSTGGANAAANQPGKSTAPTQSSVSQLPNSGPGDVVAIFVGATILGTLAHYSLTARRLNG